MAVRFVAILVGFGFLSPIVPLAAQPVELTVELGEDGADLAYDAARDRIYVSLPGANEIAVVSLATLDVVDRIAVGSDPRGIGLSPDGARLFVALSGGRSVAVVDLETKIAEEVEIDPELLGGTAFDVAAPSGGQVFVSASGGFSWIVLVEIDEEGFPARRVASDFIIRCNPTFAEDPSGAALFVGECFSPNSLYKLDLPDADAPVVAEDDHGSVSGTQRAAVSPDGALVVIGSGQILSAETLLEVGRIAPGLPAFGDASDTVHMALPGGVVETYSIETEEKTGEVMLPCELPSVDRFVVLPSDSGMVVLSRDVLCGLVTPPECTEPPPAPTAPEPSVDAELDLFGRVELSWRNVGGTCPNSFDVRFGTENPSTELACTDLRGTFCSVTELERDTTYYWQVVVRNDLGATEGPVWSFTTSDFDASALSDVEVHLGARPTDTAFDAERRRIYLSLPNLNEVAVVSIDSWEVIDRFTFGASPQGIDLSADGSTLYVATSENVSVVLFDLETGGRAAVGLAPEIGNGGAYDVVEGAPRELYVSANPGSSGFAWIVKVDLDGGNSVTRVANETIIRCNPRLAVSPDRTNLYVGECFSPNSLYRLDLTQPDAPIVAEDSHGEVGGTSHLEISPDGERIFLSGGQVVRAGSVNPVGRVEGIYPRFGDRGDVVFGLSDPSSIAVFETRGFEEVHRFDIPCRVRDVRSFVVLPDSEGWLAVFDDRLCGVAPTIECTSPPPASASPQPPDGTEDALFGSTLLAWSNEGSSCPNEYDVLFGTANPPEDLFCTGLSESRCVVDDLTVGETYYWQVIARNASGETAGSIWSFTASPGPPDANFGVELDLLGLAGDSVLDSVRELVYVSLPERSEIAIVSLRAAAIVDRVPLGGGPRGLDLSADGSRLFVALSHTAAIAIVDTETREAEEIDISAAIGGTAFDVAVGMDGRVFVSGEGLGVVDPGAGNAVAPLGDHSEIACEPQLVASAHGPFLYVSGCSGGDALLKIDVSQANAPIVASAPPADFRAGSQIFLDPRETVLSLPSGAIFDADTLEPAARIGAGIPAYDEDVIYVAAAPNRLEIYDRATFLRVDTMTLPCVFQSAGQTVLVPDGRGWIVVGEDIACGYFTALECDGPPPETLMEPSPESEAEIEGAGVVALSWTHALTDCPSEYGVLVGTESPPTELRCENLRETRCFIDDLEPGVTYYWQVVATNPEGETRGPVWSFSTIAVDPRTILDLVLVLDSVAADLELDPGRRQAYVSVPAAREILVVSTVSFAVVDRIELPFQPAGLDLATSGDALFAAVADAGAVARIDLETGESTEWDVATELDADAAFDVIESAPGELVVSPAPVGRSARFAWVDTASGSTRTAASARLVRCGATFTMDPSGEFAWAGECTQLHKLDLTQEGAPVAADSPSQAIAPADRIAVSPDGDRLYLTTGQVLRSASYRQAGLVAPGVVAVAPEGDAVYVAETPATIGIYDAKLLVRVGEISLPCEFRRIERVAALPGERGWIVLGDDLLCGVVRQNSCADAPPASAPVVPADGGALALPSANGLEWRNPGAGCPTDFDVYLDTVDPPETLLCENIAEPTCDPGELAIDTTYYWRVVARNDSGETASPVWSFTTREGVEPVFSTVDIELDAVASDLAYCPMRHAAFVSTPSTNEVVMISLASQQIVDRFHVGSAPANIDLSSDGTRLFAALSRAGAIAILDIDSGNVSEIEVADVLGDSRVFDVAEAVPDRVFVSAAPGSNGTSTIGIVRLDRANEVVQAAGGRIIRCSPTFAKDPHRRSLYVGECFSPNSLYKLDVTQDTAPIVLEDRHGSVSGTSHLAVSPDGSRVYLAGGQVVRSGSFNTDGRVGAGIHAFGESGRTVYIARAPGVVDLYDTATYEKTGEFDLPCTVERVQRFIVLPSGSGWLALADDLVCGLLLETECTESPSPPAKPVPASGETVADSSGVVARWESGDPTCVTTFDVLLGTEDPPTEVVCENIRESRCRFDSIVPDTRYFWRAIARNSQGETAGPVWSFRTPAEVIDESINLHYDVGSGAGDLEYDEPRNVVYLSVPQDGEVLVLEVGTLRITERFDVGRAPRALALSIDGSTLFVGLSSPPTVVAIDLETREASPIDVSDVVEDRVTDVLEARPGELFVAGTGIARVRLDEGNTVEATAAGRFIRCSPVLKVSPDRDFLYIGECFSPNSLYKVDLNAEGAPIVLEDRHGSVSGTDQLAVSPDGRRIYLTSGQVLRTSSFNEAGRIGSGIHEFGSTDEIVYAARPPGTIDFYDTSTFLRVGGIDLECELSVVRRLVILPDSRGWILLGDERVCARLSRPECAGLPIDPSDPSPSAGADGIRATRAMLSWNSPSSGCPQTFEVRFGTSNPPAEVLCRELTDARCAVDDLAPDTEYFWQVVGRNAEGETVGPVWSFRTDLCGTPPLEEVNVALGADGHDLEYDRTGGTIYVSLPSRDEVAIVSARTLEVVDRIEVGPEPRGIDLASDGETLYVANNGERTISIVDLATGDAEKIDLDESLGDGGAFDIAEGAPGVLFVSANPGSTGLAYIVKVDLNSDGDPVRVAGNRIVRCDPVLEVDPARRFLYIGECFSPNSLLKLDLEDPEVRVIAEDDHGEVSGTGRIAISPDGSQIIIGSGQVLATRSMREIGRVARGVHTFGDFAGEIVAGSAESGRIEFYDRESFERLDRVPFPCALDRARRLIALPGDDGWLALEGDRLCGLAAAAPVDCNENGIRDDCDIERGASTDLDESGIPDECEAPRFIRGEADGMDGVSLGDAIAILDYLFSHMRPFACVAAADVNDSGRVDLIDPVTILHYLFMSGREPWAPYPDCGEDPTPDTLACETGCE